MGQCPIIARFGLMHRGIKGYGIIGVNIFGLLNCLINVNHSVLWSAINFFYLFNILVMTALSIIKRILFSIKENVDIMKVLRNSIRNNNY